jgi:outer membrane protein
MIKLILFISLPFINCLGQNQNWNLNQCIDSALANNLSIQKAHIESEIAYVRLNESKLNLTPTFNLNLNHGYNWGQTIDLFTNQFASNRIQFDNFYFSSSLILFNGLQNYYQIQQSNEKITQSNINTDIKQRNLKIDVCAAYIQILMNENMVDLYERKLNYNVNGKRIIEIKIANGNSTYFELQELENTIQKDSFLLIKAKNDVSLLKINLQYIMNLNKISDNFSIDENIHLSNFPYIDTNQLNVDSNLELDLLRSKLNINLIEHQKLIGKYFPSISMFNTLGTGYSQNNKELNINGDFETIGLKHQISDNFYNTLIFNVNIPIYNKGFVKNQIKINELETQSIQLDLCERKNVLLNQLLKLHLDIENKFHELDYLIKLQSLFKSELNNALIKFEKGEISSYEYSTILEKYFDSETESIKASYQLKLAEILFSLLI